MFGNMPYYLKYHNKRPEYITNWWHVVNWKKVQEQFASNHRLARFQEKLR